ncbi:MULTISPECIES: hypothetical protein [unclassified Halobacteriovorax]|uniref:hypothetical protein n=1 Tax=unclassified Halobacteriovorax TaxID=2639665 RepID=UPI000EA278E1|nr:hypothetical protein [Halobacteriovorax sp. BALOs_7]AYF44787.1 hypothetical protein BALOs_1787 [Halobacteriovorax sp. BALOs_7]
MKNQEESIKLIEKVTRSFYQKAINDVFIGYHFRKLTSNNGPISNIEDFNEHLKSINAFWQAQLLGIKLPKGAHHLLSAHEYLKIRKGELGRWVVLFKQTLEENRSEDPKFINIWEHKIDTFKVGFEKYFFEG